MAWFGRKREIEELKAQLADVAAGRAPGDLLAREFAETSQRLTEARRSFSQGTWDEARWGDYRNTVTGLTKRAEELRNQAEAEGRAIGGFPWILEGARI